MRIGLVIILSAFVLANNEDSVKSVIDGLPMADFLDESQLLGDEEIVKNGEETIDRWEAPPEQLLPDVDLAKDSDILLQNDNAGGDSLARQEIYLESQVNSKSEEDWEPLPESLNTNDQEETMMNKNMEDETNTTLKFLDIYNVDDFDEKYDDVQANDLK